MLSTTYDAIVLPEMYAFTVNPEEGGSDLDAA